MDEMEIVVQFARLWGMETADSRLDKEKYQCLESYDSEELLELLSVWKNEYFNDENAEDFCEFFNEKIKTI